MPDGVMAREAGNSRVNGTLAPVGRSNIVRNATILPFVSRSVRPLATVQSCHPFFHHEPLGDIPCGNGF
jgi:hypothetical protein